MHKDIVPISLSKPSSSSFTLIELIVVIIIVGILAAVGISQYSAVVEKGRIAEAKVRIGTMRTLAYQYYLENGSMVNLDAYNVGVVGGYLECNTTGFYTYWAWAGDSSYDWISLSARRCSSGGKTPDATRPYELIYRYWFLTNAGEWYCTYLDNGSGCFGMPSWG